MWREGGVWEVEKGARTRTGTAETCSRKGWTGTGRGIIQADEGGS